jgi:hypothetical protein
MLAVLLAILTAAGGLYVCGNLLSLDHFKSGILQQEDGNRDVAHAILAGSIIVLGLIMAILAKWAPRSRLLLSGFAFLTLLVIAGQFWLGTLLLFDGSKGSLVQFRQSDQEPTTGPSLDQSLNNATHAIGNDLSNVGNDLKNAASNAESHLQGLEHNQPTMPAAPTTPAPTTPVVPEAPAVPAPTAPATPALPAVPAIPPAPTTLPTK